jgi:hypothetical protein
MHEWTLTSETLLHSTVVIGLLLKFAPGLEKISYIKNFNSNGTD